MKAHLRNPGLVRIFINGEHTFTVKLMDAADLKTGLALTDDRMASLQHKHEQEEAYRRSIQYLAYRPRSRNEIVQHLNKKKYSPAVVAETIRRWKIHAEDHGISLQRFGRQSCGRLTCGLDGPLRVGRGL